MSNWRHVEKQPHKTLIKSSWKAHEESEVLSKGEIKNVLPQKITDADIMKILEELHS